MNTVARKWGTLIILSIIWGSSYILIKKGLIGLTPIQVGSLRMIITTLIIVPFSLSVLKQIPKNKIKWVVFSAFIGTFFPNYLFAFAETEISSAVAGVMVSLTPLFTLLISVIFFNEKFLKKQFFGVVVGFVGILILVNNEFLISGLNLLYVSFTILAAFFYAINANILKYKLPNISAVAIIGMSFIFLCVPAFFILLSTDFPILTFTNDSLILESIFYIVVLAVFGTAIAKVLYIKLLAISSPVFSVSTTYLIPVVAIIWGILDGEEFKLIQFLGTLVILIGVYLVTKKGTS
ncbi:MAG: DMT family transporter [Bacteroidota bacterium]